MPVHLLSVSKTIVDMRLSKFNETTSKPELGEFDWIDKKYIDYFTSPRPEYAFFWERYDPRNAYRDVIDAKLSGGWEIMKYPRDNYFCEGATFTPEQSFTYGDLILMRRPLKREIEERMEHEKMAKGNTGQAHLDAYAAARKATGENVEQKIIDDMLRSL